MEKLFAWVIAIINEKGGVGKTTTALNLGYALQEEGKRVLLIDLSTQGSLTKLLGHNPKQLDSDGKTITASLVDNVPMADLVISGYVDFVPSGKSINQRQFPSLMVLREALAPLKPKYDHVLIDSPPEIERLMIRALIAADSVLIPTKVDRLSTDGIGDMFETISMVRSRYNPGLTVDGVLPTMFDSRRKNDRKYLRALKQFETRGTRVFDRINENADFLTAAEEGRAATDMFKHAPGVLRYYQLAQYYLHHE